jgi:hypothetical protein
MEEREMNQAEGDTRILKFQKFLKRPATRTGIVVAVIHFTLFAILLEPLSSYCLTNTLPLGPSYFLIFVPIVSDLLTMIAGFMRSDEYFMVFISSCYYGLAIGWMVSAQKKYKVTGIILISIAIFAGFVVLLFFLATGCGTA